MLGLIKKVLGGDDALKRDAEAIYRTVMDQARRPEFYGSSRVPDTFQGRMELLVVHLAVVMKACLLHGDQGKRLQEALFDRMRDDFDVALREEGYSDTGVKHRIKKMMQLFYQTVRQVFEALDETTNDSLVAAMESDEGVSGLGEAGPTFKRELAAYLRTFHETTNALDLGDLARARLAFPKPPA